MVSNYSLQYIICYPHMGLSMSVFIYKWFSLKKSENCCWTFISQLHYKSKRSLIAPKGVKAFCNSVTWVTNFKEFSIIFTCHNQFVEILTLAKWFAAPSPPNIALIWFQFPYSKCMAECWYDQNEEHMLYARNSSGMTSFHVSHNSLPCLTNQCKGKT